VSWPTISSAAAGKGKLLFSRRSYQIA
jgi:hypothetical protein